MADQLNDASSVTHPESSGIQGNVSESKDSNKDFVAYETHRKLLGQRKNDQGRIGELEAKLAEIDAREKQQEESRLAEQGEYKKLLDIKSRKLEELESSTQAYKKQLTDGTKYQAFVDALPGELESSKYLGLVDIDKIVIDPETGSVDDMSVKEVVDTYIKEFPSSVKARNAANKLPNQATPPLTATAARVESDPQDRFKDLVKQGLI